MERVELKIYYTENDVTKLRCMVNKWKFQDTMMGEQFITFSITSEIPIDFAVGDFCEFRGETYTLNYVPSATQRARTKERQDAYTYESVKFESYQEELTRCIMLDITPTTGDYVAALGTNHTGSSRFQLFCGETTANGSTLTAVCALVAKMQANLDRMFPSNGWSIHVDTTTTYRDSSGNDILVTHTEDKVLSFDNSSVAKALEEVHNTFDLDYCIRGRNIYIGYNLKNLTSENENETFVFGYGKGYPTREDQDKALFQIKRIANSQQKIVTRLRALGSTKNLPYRYYNKKYSKGNDDLSQTLFPTNLQLPDTFESPEVKTANNALRDSTLRAVRGDTNDAYIDKNDDAEHCAEGIREDSARWDGTNSDLQEIYPTIEEATYGELRSALVQDQDGQTGSSSFPNYGDSERIDKLLAVGYKDGGTLVDDANKGNGILPESGISVKGIPRSANIGLTNLSFSTRNSCDFSFRTDLQSYAGKERELFSIQGVSAGKYAISPTIGAVLYGFTLSCYKEGVSADIGYVITVRQRNIQTGETITIATYVSDYINVSVGDKITEVELPSIPDATYGSDAKVSEIEVTSLSDITVTFSPLMRNVNAPGGFTGYFALSYQVGNSRLDNSVTYEPEYNWIPLDDSGNVSETFHVFVQDMGFDLQTCWTDDTPVVAMKSGRCVGREFEISENIEKVTHDGKKGYMLTLKRATDNTLNTYYPSVVNPITAGDHFVLLNISMPDAYVKMAEVRLLRAATEYLADNCETQFTYQPSIDDIYLQRNYDNMVKAGTPQASIFWRLYAGLKFTFRGIPASEDSLAPLADITIEQVIISMGEGLTPKVELKLNDDVQQSTIQKLTTSVDRIYNGSIFNSGSVASGGGGAMSAAVLSILQSEGEKLFLSKKHDDVAEGKITFNDIVTHNETLKAKKGLKVGNFNSRLLGSGALIDEEGNAEFESIYSRNFISTPEFRFNRVNVTEGEQWCTNGYGTIKEVEIIDETTGYITLKLEENDYASIAEGDICRGIYNDVAHEYQTASLDDDTELYAGENEGNVEGFGFSSKEGFFTSYFWVRQMITNTKGECKFLYELRNTKTPHPCEFMKFAQYGSFTNSERRSSSYATSIGHYYEMVLDGVSTWKIKSANVVYRKGYLGNMTVTLKTGKEAELKGYGLYVQDNVYFGNAVVQLDPETIANLQDALTSYSVDFSGYVDVVTVDDVGNVIGGLWTLSGENNEYRSYRIHSAITVRKNGDLLVIAADDADAGEGTYKIYAQPKGCTCIIENSTIYITGINNIKDGVAGSADDANFDYAAMRAMDSCSVDIIVDCEGKGSIVKNFPIRIKHDSQPFVGADISNEFSAVSWNTQTQRYIGLPIVFDMKMWHNNEPLDIASVNDISISPAIDNMTIEKSIVTNTNGAKVARITIAELPVNLGLVTDLNVTCVATYSGVQYERTLVHTINKTTDTNVYQLLPSVSEVGVVYNDNKQKVVNTNKVFCTVRCDSTDDKHYTVATSDYVTHGLFITYQTFSLNSSGVEVGGEESAYSSLNGVAVSTDFTRIRFKLYKLRDTTLGTLAELLAASNVIEVLDTEDVPVVLDGLDGDNSIFVSLDNQNDTVTCLEDGTVIASTLPHTKARLMDGEDTVGRSALGTTMAANKQTLGNWSLVCHGCTAELIGWVADTDNKDWVQIKVTGVTEDVASVDINCQYAKHGSTGNYVSILSIKKIYGLDKYDLTFNPPIVSYNPNTNTYTPESFNVYVWKTTQEEDRHLMPTLPTHSTATDGDVRLQYSVDNGVTWNTLTGYSSGGTVGQALYGSVVGGAVLFRLQKYVVGESGSEWVLLDEEGVEINRSGLDGKGVEYIFITKNDWDGTDANKPTINDVASERQVDNYCPYTDAQHTDQWTDEPSGIGVNQKFEFYAQRKKVNGVWQPFGDVKLWDRYASDGQSPYMIDLTNEQSFVNCREDGTVLSSYETSNLMIFKGNSYAFTDFNFLITPTNVRCNGNSSAFSLTDAQKATAQSNGYFTLTPSELTASSGTISIQATLKTNTNIVLVAVYKVNKNIAGQSGVVYSLLPSLNVIHKNNTGVFLDTNIITQVKKTVGTTTSILNTHKEIADEGLTIDYQNYAGTTDVVTSNDTSTSTVSLLASSFVGGTNGIYGVLRLKTSDGTIVDTERINVVADGADGSDGTSVRAAYSFNSYPSEPWEGMVVLIDYDDASTDMIDVLENGVWESYIVDIGSVYICDLDNHYYEATDTGWRDCGRFTGEDGIIYYLTSSINSIIRYSSGDYAGTARPVITAWKKVGNNDAVRLNDITTPSVAEGFIIKAYEMDGSSIEHVNSSSTGILTCSTPFSYVDRLEVELIKDNKIYATMSIPIVTEQQGATGLTPYPAGAWLSSVTYTRDSSTCPYVLHNGRYWLLNVSSCNNSEPSTGNSNWKMMSQFDVVYAQIMLADFGKIAASVFTGDWQLSQYGKNSLGVTEDETSRLRAYYKDCCTDPDGAYILPDKSGDEFISEVAQLWDDYNRSYCDGEKLYQDMLDYVVYDETRLRRVIDICYASYQKGVTWDALSQMSDTSYQLFGSVSSDVFKYFTPNIALDMLTGKAYFRKAYGNFIAPILNITSSNFSQYLVYDSAGSTVWSSNAMYINLPHIGRIVNILATGNGSVSATTGLLYLMLPAVQADEVGVEMSILNATDINVYVISGNDNVYSGSWGSNGRWLLERKNTGRGFNTSRRKILLKPFEELKLRAFSETGWIALGKPYSVTEEVDN